jgi:hypothetical protein
LKQLRRVAALAGRRIDPADAVAVRFPRSSLASVRDQLEEIFLQEKLDLLVCSAASGADLLALEVASNLEIECRIVLPFSPDRFRATSVVDSSSEWGMKYDELLGKAASSGNLIIGSGDLSEEEAYMCATRIIVTQANAAAAPEKAIAIIVWEGRSRGHNDFTSEFRDLALRAGMRTREVHT